MKTKFHHLLSNIGAALHFLTPACCVVAALFVCRVSAEDGSVTVRSGKTRSVQVSKQVNRSSISIGDTSIAGASFDGGRLYVYGRAPGRTWIAFSGEYVVYQTGIPPVEKNRPRRELRSIPAARYVPFRDMVSVTVIPAEERSARPQRPPGNGQPGRHERQMEVPLLRSRNVYLHPIGSQLRNVSAISADPQCADVRSGDNWAQIMGRKPGRATVIVRGECWTANREWKPFVLRLETVVR